MLVVITIFISYPNKKSYHITQQSGKILSQKLIISHAIRGRITLAPESSHWPLGGPPQSPCSHVGWACTSLPMSVEGGREQAAQGLHSHCTHPFSLITWVGWREGAWASKLLECQCQPQTAVLCPRRGHSRLRGMLLSLSRINSTPGLTSPCCCWRNRANFVPAP